MKEKYFKKWVSDNFKGFSPHTLFEFLHKFSGFSVDYALNLVYVELYNYALKINVNDDSENLFYTIKNSVDNCTWL